MAKLDSEIQAFVAAHPGGWSHGEWEQLLNNLADKKVKVPDTDQLGVRLEAERLRQSLRSAGLAGLGPKRVDAIVDRFGSVQNLRGASAEEVASASNMPRRLAEDTLAQFR